MLDDRELDFFLLDLIHLRIPWLGPLSTTFSFLNCGLLLSILSGFGALSSTSTYWSLYLRSYCFSWSKGCLILVAGLLIDKIHLDLWHSIEFEGKRGWHFINIFQHPILRIEHHLRRRRRYLRQLYLVWLRHLLSVDDLKALSSHLKGPSIRGRSDNCRGKSAAVVVQPSTSLAYRASFILLFIKVKFEKIPTYMNS